MADFVTPKFEDYLNADNLNEYIVQLWQGVENKDRESILTLLYLAVKAEAVKDVIPMAVGLMGVDDEYIGYFDKQINKELNAIGDDQTVENVTAAMHTAYAVADKTYHEAHPDYVPFEGKFGDAEALLIEGYRNQIGKPDGWGWD